MELWDGFLGFDQDRVVNRTGWFVDGWIGIDVRSNYVVTWCSG